MNCHRLHPLFVVLATGALTTPLQAQTATPDAQAPAAAPEAPSEEPVIDAGEATSATPAAGDSRVSPAVAASATTGSAGTATASANQVEAAPAATSPATPPSAAPGTEPTGEAKTSPLVDVDGYLQAQYEHHADSLDQLRQGGAPYNQDRFVVKRARLILSRRWDYTGLYLELDGNTASGAAFGLHRAEASLFVPPAEGHKESVLELTAGLAKIPFGYETPESSRSRWFMERSTASRAFFPSEVDVGATLGGSWRFLRYSVGLFNGQPKGSPSFALQDPNASKDVVVRVGATGKPREQLELSGGVSFLRGDGFHAGTDAGKNQVVWRDLNENGNIDSGELSGNPGDAALPSSNFERWGVEADARLSVTTRLGKSTVFAEAVLASNLDRGLFIADPTLGSSSVREFGWHVGATQSLTRYALIGARYDHYDPNSDLMDARAGQLYPLNQSIDTVALLGALSLQERARLSFEYDLVYDKLARSAIGTPTDLDNNQWILRLQVNL